MDKKIERVGKLTGLGPKSEECLNEIGIFTQSDLEQIGPIKAFIKLRKECRLMKPSLNFLYAMVATLEGVHWKNIAKSERGRLLMELKDYTELETILNEAYEGAFILDIKNDSR